MELRDLKNDIKYLYYEEDEIYKINNRIKFISDLWEEQRPNNKYTILDDNRYDENSRVKLQKVSDSIDENVKEIFFKRRSYLLSEFSGKFSYQELTDLINVSLGVSGERVLKLYNDDINTVKLRTYPAGGALYTIDIYLYIRDIEGIESGLYIADINENELIKVKNEVELEEVEGLSPITYLKLDKYNNSFINSNILVFLVANYKKSFKKYGLLTYKLALLEAGHIAQNLQLVATHIGKKSLPMCGYFDDKVEEFLKINGKDEVCLYMIALG